ncbi:MAG: efflux RND transporter periplasmic adaptor subunit [Terracidiphilus sp.]
MILILVFFLTRYLLRDQLTVRESRVDREVLLNTISTNGKVEPEVNYQFYSPISTTVKAVYVQAGDKVPAGKLLMLLDDTDARAREATAESGVKAAQASLDAATHNGTQEQRQMAAGDIARTRLERDQARHDLDALTKLNSAGAASASEVSAARERLQTAEASLHASEESAGSRYSSAEVARAQAALADAEAGLAAARKVVSQTAIHAPMAGTVYSVDAARTEYAEQGKLLMQIADLGNERVRAYFDEPDIGRLQAGQKIVIKWDAKPGQEWHGHIERAPVTVITYGTRNVGVVLVGIDDEDGTLLPDTNVNVTVTTSSEPDALSIPREALYSSNGKPYVFKVVKDNLVRTPVVTSITNLTRVAIVSGLNEGDWVATGTLSGQPLQEGVPVKVVR